MPLKNIKFVEIKMSKIQIFTHNCGMDISEMEEEVVAAMA